MFTNSRRFDLAASSTGALALSWGPLSHGSQSATAVNRLVKQEESKPILQIVPSFGSLVLGYGKQLIATTSAHTILDSLILPITLGEEFGSIVLQPNTEVRELSEELREIEALTGLHKARIAEDLFNVSRMAYHHWTIGKRVSLENERRIRGTLDVLRRASVRHADPNLLRGWLLTPVGSQAVAPISLLKAGRIDAARLLAVSGLSHRASPLPEWLLTGPLDAWSEREQKRQDFVMRESDATFRDDVEE